MSDSLKLAYCDMARKREWGESAATLYKQLKRKINVKYARVNETT